MFIFTSFGESLSNLSPAKSCLTTKSANAGKIVFKAAIVAIAMLLPYAAGYVANADTIQIANVTTRADITAYSAVLDAHSTNTGTTLGYDAGIDHDLDTSNNPESYASVIYAELADTSAGLHAVDYNYAQELQIGESYMLVLSWENNTGYDFYDITNHLTLSDFDIDNTNGVTDYEYVLSVNTDSAGDEYDYTTSGLLSEVWSSPDKKLAQWTQDFRQGLDWRLGRTYGELTLTAVGVPEPSTAVLLVMAGLAGIGLAGRRW